MNRNKRRLLADETLQILEKKQYQIENKEINIAVDLSRCCEKTYSIPSDKHEEIEIEKRYEKNIFSVAEETTLNGIEYANQKYSHIGVLNFASAKNPGGVFLSGSQAQEESLARSSGLYASLNLCFDYYQYHRNLRNPLYSDYMIVSPKVPFFRNDSGKLKEKPILCTVFTSPAVNKGAIRDKKNHLQIYGILASVDMSPELRQKTLQEGFYVARIQDQVFELDIPENFQPQSY